MKKLFRKVIEWGIFADTPVEQAHHYRLTNSLLLFLIVSSILQTSIYVFAGALKPAALNSMAPFVFILGLLMMKSGRTLLARIFVVAVSYVVGFVLISALGPQSYFQFIFLFASALSIVLFSTEEKFWLFLAAALPLLAFCYLEIADYQPLLGMERPDFSADEIAFMKVASMFVMWSLLVFHFVYFIRGRRRLQEKLVSSAKMVGLGRMAAGIAHEVNNPLQMIVSNAERLNVLARASSIERREIERTSDNILTVSMRIASIVKGLLALSRDASNDQMYPVQLYSVLKTSLDCCRARFESSQVEIKLGLVSERWAIKGRATQLSEVILNLLDNGYDAVSESAVKRIEIDVVATKDCFEIKIKDTGPGIDQKIRNRIFDPFFTTKPVGEGIGLGLSVSLSIVHAHGGQLFLDPMTSETHFVVRLPRSIDIDYPQLEMTRQSLRS